MVSTGVWKVIAAGALVLGLGTSAMAADMGPIESRQACMKANGKVMGVMVPMIKGEQAYDSDAIQAITENVLQDPVTQRSVAAEVGSNRFHRLDTPAGKREQIVSCD